MVSAVAPGTPITIVRRSSPPEQWTAAVVVAREDSIAARVSDPPPAWQPDGDYMIIQGSPGGRTFAICSFVAAKNGVAAFRLATHWRPLDLRKDRRYPADLQVEVRSVLGTSRQPGRLVDISMGGLAVTVETRPGGSQLEVSLWNGGYSASVPCELVRPTEAPNGHTVLHLRFRELTPSRQAFIRQFIASLQAAQGEAP
ncbi:MAG: hypothetical protein AMXMBFR80_17980 [Dehalococcoidia bacterium]|jgi:hypothetical protein